MIIVICDLCKQPVANGRIYTTVSAGGGAPFEIGACCEDKPFRVPDGHRPSQKTVSS